MQFCIRRRRRRRAKHLLNNIAVAIIHTKRCVIVCNAIARSILQFELAVSYAR